MLKGMIRKFLLALIVISFTSVTLLQAQPQSSPPDGIERLIKAADQYYTLDDKLINGFIYPMPDSRIKGNPWLGTREWSEGTIYIGDDLYENLMLKYDITEGDLILKARFGEGTYKVLELPYPRVDSFRLGNDLFVRSDKFATKEEEPFYYEQIMDNGLTFVRRHIKHFVSKYDDLSPYGLFSETQTNNYFIDSGKRTQVDRRGQFIRYFKKPTRKAIRRYIRQNNIRYGRASSSELKDLLRYCNELIFPEKNQ